MVGAGDLRVRAAQTETRDAPRLDGPSVELNSTVERFRPPGGAEPSPSPERRRSSIEESENAVLLRQACLPGEQGGRESGRVEGWGCDGLVGWDRAEGRMWGLGVWLVGNAAVHLLHGGSTYYGHTY